jgi:hypothetical protein
LPVYEIGEQQHKGPQLFSCDGDFVAPDMLAFKSKGPILFVEAKHKNAFTWSRRQHQFSPAADRFETGIDGKHFQDYQQVKDETGVPLWILFLQDGRAAKDAPVDKPTSPRGLYGGEIDWLAKTYSHTDERWGKGGMIYWSPFYPDDTPALRRLANYEDVA